MSGFSKVRPAFLLESATPWQLIGREAAETQCA
jgi:hypothetical protein